MLSLEVCSFLYLQPDRVKADPMLLHDVPCRQCSDSELEEGLTVVLDLKQGRQEIPPAYYNYLRFGSWNKPDMEEDEHFKVLFLRNLHSTQSHYLGFIACPHTMTIPRLCDLVTKAYHQQRAASGKMPKSAAVWDIATLSLDSTQEGVHHENQPRACDQGWKHTPSNHDHSVPSHMKPKSKADYWEKQHYSKGPRPIHQYHWSSQGNRLPISRWNPPLCHQDRWRGYHYNPKHYLSTKGMTQIFFNS